VLDCRRDQACGLRSPLFFVAFFPTDQDFLKSLASRIALGCNMRRRSSRTQLARLPLVELAIRIRSVVGASEFHGDAGKGVKAGARVPSCEPSGVNPHQLPDPLNLGGFNPYAALSLGTALEVADRDRLTADDEKSPVRLAKPVVKAHDRQSKPPGGLICG
jgi:hypothetical protein